MSVTCDLPRSGLSPAYPIFQTWIGLPTSGVFAVHAGREEYLVHPAVGVIFPRDTEYRMTHPIDGGDTSAALAFSPAVTEEALPAGLERVRATRLDLHLRQRLGVLLAAVAAGDRMRVEELSLALMRAIAAGLVASPAPYASSTARRTIDRIRVLLAERPETPWTLDSLGRIAGYSPFHLAHQFRACTGTSIHRYLADVRLAAALQRIEAGDTSLAAVAADLGFSHHSHLTATLRRRLGATPRMIRERLRGEAPRIKPH